MQSSQWITSIKARILSQTLRFENDGIIAGIKTIQGVKNSVSDKHDTRLVVTYDRRHVKLSKITALFGRHDLNVTLLNQINHRQHQNRLKKEEEELETS